MTEQASRRIYWMRLICAIMVIGIHCENSVILNQSAENWSSIAQNWITNNIYCIAVPVFFMLSGFFCYYQIETKVYLPRWRKRVLKTAYLYVLWNIIYTLYHFAKIILLTPGNISGEVSVIAVFKGIFLYEYNEPWWFMFQLLILEICSPMIYKLLKGNVSRWLLVIGVFGSALSQSLGLINNEYVRSDVWIWYNVGVYIGFLKPEVFLEPKGNDWKKGIVVFLCGEILLVILQSTVMAGFRWLPILIMAIGFCQICKVGKYKKPFPDELKCTFFIYAVHQLIGGILYRFQNAIFPIGNVESFILFLLNPIILLVIVVFLIKILKKMSLYSALVMEIHK